MLYRIKDFICKDVQDVKGKRIGTIKDIVLDISQNKVIGFEVSATSFTNDCFIVPIESVLYFDKSFIIEKNNISKRVEFHSIKSLDIVDIFGNMIGVLEDVLLDTKNLKIKGFISSMGFIKSYIYGKSILLSKDLLFGEECILFTPKNKTYSMISSPHSINFEVGKYEK